MHAWHARACLCVRACTHVHAYAYARTQVTAQPVQPFRLHFRSCVPTTIGFEYGSGHYSVNIHCERLSRVRAAGYAPYSRMTPLRAVAFSEEEKARYSVPADATFFAWAFPLQGSLGLNFEPQTAEEEVVVYGAFAFFKDADALISLNAATFADEGQPFEGPHKLLPTKGKFQPLQVKDGAKLRDYLVDSGRIHPVATPHLKMLGVEYFWWLGPSEPIAQEDGSAWRHGAFVYLYRAGDEQLDCFLDARLSKTNLWL